VTQYCKPDNQHSVSIIYGQIFGYLKNYRLLKKDYKALGSFVGFSQYTANFYVFIYFLFLLVTKRKYINTYIKIGCVLTETYKTS